MSDSEMLHSNPNVCCERCNHMTSTIEGLRCLISPDGYPHLTKIDLEKTSALGCSFCALMNSILKPKTQADRQRQVHLCIGGQQGFFKAQPNDSTAYPLENLKVNIIGTAGLRSNSAFNAILLDVLANPDDPSSRFVPKRPVHRDVGGKFATAKAEEWLRTCQQHHKLCPSPVTSILPTRIIDIGLKADNSQIRLNLSSPLDRGPYVALSYCWGGKQRITLSSTNVAELSRDLPFQRLDKTIQDAIVTTRKLGVRYLWIDALCIIQDDQDDKNKEINGMASIYKNAMVTIAAASAAAVSTGFIQPRMSSQPLTQFGYLPFLLPDGNLGSIAIAKPIYAHVANDPLSKRAWALQEYLLSPRVLWYGEDELTWHCQTFQDWQVAPSHIAYYGTPNRLSSDIYALESLYHRRISSKQQARVWRSIIEDYSGRSLTHQQDRLPALSGLSSALESPWQDKLFYGLWQGCLIENLTWYRPQYIASPDKSNTHTAPSWSWASLECKVEFKSLEIPAVDLLECCTTSDTATKDDPGKIVLRGKMVATTSVLKADISSWLLYSDLDAAMPEVENIHYLLLGWSTGRDWKRQRKAVALALSSLGSGKFARVGLVWYCQGDVWESIKLSTVSII